MKVQITNTTLHPLNLCYRMPKKEGDTKSNPVIKVRLNACALMNEVAFPNESFFNVFKEQNKQYIDNGTIVIGSTTAKKAEKASQDNAELERKEVFKKIDNNTQQLETSAKGARGKMSVKVQKDTE